MTEDETFDRLRRPTFNEVCDLMARYFIGPRKSIINGITTIHNLEELNEFLNMYNWTWDEVFSLLDEYGRRRYI